MKLKIVKGDQSLDYFKKMFLRLVFRLCSVMDASEVSEHKCLAESGGEGAMSVMNDSDTFKTTGSLENTAQTNASGSKNLEFKAQRTTRQII